MEYCTGLYHLKVFFSILLLTVLSCKSPAIKVDLEAYRAIEQEPNGKDLSIVYTLSNQSTQNVYFPGLFLILYNKSDSGSDDFLDIVPIINKNDKLFERNIELNRVFLEYRKFFGVITGNSVTGIDSSGFYFIPAKSKLTFVYRISGDSLSQDREIFYWTYYPKEIRDYYIPGRRDTLENVPEIFVGYHLLRDLPPAQDGRLMVKESFKF